MKLEIDLEDLNGHDSESVADILRNEIKYQVKAHFSKMIAGIIAQEKKKLEKVIREAIKGDWDVKMADFLSSSRKTT